MAGIKNLTESLSETALAQGISAKQLEMDKLAALRDFRRSYGL